MAPRLAGGHDPDPIEAPEAAGTPARRRLAVRTVDPLGRSIGAAGVAASAALIVAPGAVVRRVGLDDTPGARLIARTVGGRQLGSSAGILASRRPTAWLWGRVAGDGVDLALLALGAAVQARSGPPGLRGRFRRRSGWSRRTLTAVALVVVIGLVDLVAAIRLTRRRGPHRTASGSIVVDRPPDEVYLRWRQVQDEPRFLSHLELRPVRGAARSIATSPDPAEPVEREAAVVREVPGELIEWRSGIASEVDHAGIVRFEPMAAGRSTLVSVQVDFRPPGGLLGSLVAGLFGEHPRQQVADDLVRFKHLLEGPDADEPDGDAP